MIGLKNISKRKDDFWENNALGSVMITSLSAFCTTVRFLIRKKDYRFWKKDNRYGSR